MNSHFPLIPACVLTLGLAGAARPQTPSNRTQPVSAARLAPVASPEEDLIRATYEKMTTLSRASQLTRVTVVNTPIDESRVLKFTLGGFRVGPIQEVWGTPVRELSTPPLGDIIGVERIVTQHNKGPEQVGYSADWATGQYSSGYDPKWTLGDMLGFESAKYYDVGKYASYEVTVSLGGKARTYRALVLFHSPNGSTDFLRPEFWDGVVGLGGTLTDVWREKRAPAGRREAPPGGAAPAATAPMPSQTTGGGDDGQLSPTVVDSPPPALAPIEKDTHDSSEHTSGAHGETVGFEGQCSRDSTQQ